MFHNRLMGGVEFEIYDDLCTYTMQLVHWCNLVHAWRMCTTCIIYLHMYYLPWPNFGSWTSMSPTVSLNCVALHISLSSLSLSVYIYIIYIALGGAVLYHCRIYWMGRAVLCLRSSTVFHAGKWVGWHSQSSIVCHETENDTTKANQNAGRANQKRFNMYQREPKKRTKADHRPQFDDPNLGLGQRLWWLSRSWANAEKQM